MKPSNVAIIGSGIIGMGIARGLIELDSSLRIHIYEKESNIGLHASSRNSGVIHAGFYYSPDSLKARFCRQGNVELQKFINQQGLPLLKTGKVVVAQNQEEESRLSSLIDRGVANGVQLEQFASSEIARFEPHAKSHGSFIWSPNTCISSPTAVNDALRQVLQSKGVVFLTNTTVSIEGEKWKFDGEEIQTDYVVNAAGAWAMDLAHKFSVGKRFRAMPFLGMYTESSRSNLPLNTLVYPVPHPINPFLGVHLSLTIDGKIKIGPSALPIFGKGQYHWTSPLSMQEVIDFPKNLLALTRGDKHNLFEMMRYELPKLRTKSLVAAAANLVPEVRNVPHWKRVRPGIRGQLVDITEGELIQDFVVEHKSNTTHVLNAVSPGWTSSLPFGRYIAEMVIERLSSSR